MSRVLIDTNVYVSAVVFGGNPALVLQLIESLGIGLAISAEIRSEFVETLSRKFGWSDDRIHAACGRFWADAHWVEPEPIFGIVRDANDDHILAAAVSSGATIIVTGDRDLLSIGEFQGIRIVSPSTFLALFGID